MHPPWVFGVQINFICEEHGHLAELSMEMSDMLSLSQDPINTKPQDHTHCRKGDPSNPGKSLMGSTIRVNRRLDMAHTAHGPRSLLFWL